MKTSHLDVRQEKRYGIAAPVTFWWPASDGSVRSGHGITRNISSRGLLVKTTECPLPGSLVQLTVVLPRSNGKASGVALYAEGNVIRVESDRSPSSGVHNTGFVASVQFYPEGQSAAGQLEDSLSEAGATPKVN